MKKTPTKQQIDRLFDYDPKTGVFTRRGTKRIVGSISLSGYLIIRVGDRTHLAHRMAWMAYYGEAPASNIHHVNGNRADNRIANLRLTQPKQTKGPSVSNSGVRGVSFHTTGKWRASVTLNGRLHHLGVFSSIAEAASHVASVRATGIVPEKKPRANDSGHRGVYWYKPTKKWCAMLRIKGKLLNLGVYKDKEEAAKRVQYAIANPEAILIEKGIK